MSFGANARKVRDARLPYGRRIVAFHACVERYRPIGFHHSLSFLEEIAGPYRTDENALLRALDALAASRAARKIIFCGYAEARKDAKQRGERWPHPDAPNPHMRVVWYGDVRRAALHVVRAGQAELARLAHACGTGSVEAKLSTLTDRAIASRGELSAESTKELAEIMDMLSNRSTPDLYFDDAKSFFHVRRLWRAGRSIEDAAASEE